MSESSRTSSAADSLRMSYAHARDAAKEVVGQVRDRATSYYGTGKDKAHDAQLKVEEFVREQPLKSVLIAAGVGLALGVLLRRL